MIKKLFVLAAVLTAACNLMAEKTIYIPREWKNFNSNDTLLYAETDTECKYTWSKTRSRETDNVIVFWDKYYGDKAPDQLATSSDYYVDINDLLKKCEAFFDLELNTLGFVDPETSNLSRYKVMVLMNHTTTWTCYGGGYDYQVSALWLNPSTCKPVGHSVAHEIGHSFHYMCYSEHSKHTESSTDNTGFHLACGNGQAVWEQTAQWQANQSYPELMYSQSIGVFRNSHNLAYSHEWHRYQSYWFHYYLCQHYQDLTTVAQAWNQPMTGQTSGSATDFNQALMKLKGLQPADLYRLYYDYAARCATWDLDVCKPYRNSYIGDFHYAAVLTGDRQYQVALESVPQSSGFNVIPLTVPESGTQVKATFTSLKPANATPLADGDPALYLDGNTQWAKSGRTTYFTTGTASTKGFRLGFVALLADGTRQYIHEDSVYCRGANQNEAELTMTVPEGTEQMWMIVSPAPTKYFCHKWDENFKSNDDNWPYQVAFEGTDINAKRAVIYAPVTIDGRLISDANFTYDVYMPKRPDGDFTPVPVTVSAQAAATLGTAFQMQPTDIADRMVSYASAGPAEGKIMFYPVNPKTLKIVKRGSTANGYGHWFAAAGGVTDFGSGVIYSEFQPSTLTFNIGEKAVSVAVGKTYTVSQAMVYNDGTHTATAVFTFRVHITDGKSDVELAEMTTGIEALQAAPSATSTGCYDLSGRRTTKPRRGIYIRDGKKILK